MSRMCHVTTCVLEWMHAGDHEYESATAAPSLPAVAGDDERPLSEVADVACGDIIRYATAVRRMWGPPTDDEAEAAHRDSLLTVTRPIREVEAIITDRAILVRLLAALRSTLEARDEILRGIWKSLVGGTWDGQDFSSLTEVAEDDSAALRRHRNELGAARLELGELTRERDREAEAATFLRRQADVSYMLQEDDKKRFNAELAAREQRIGELEKENDALRSRL